jgi:hypothetical protein
MKTQRLLRDHRWALLTGVGAVVLIQAAIFALARRDTAPVPNAERTVKLLPEASPPATFESLEVAAPQTPEKKAPTAAVPSRKARTPKPAVVTEPEAPVTVAMPAPSPEPAPEPVKAELAPVPMPDPQASETAPAATPATEPAPVYQPGSIGKAKRGWAGAGSDDANRGPGMGWDVVVGRPPAGGGDPGHCPRPGRGRRPAR